MSSGNQPSERILWQGKGKSGQILSYLERFHAETTEKRPQDGVEPVARRNLGYSGHIIDQSNFVSVPFSFAHSIAIKMTRVTAITEDWNEPVERNGSLSVLSVLSLTQPRTDL